ncbi:MAG: hypothetical protein VB050_06495 [Geobacteraceae bacterium]|nr:hypothetical protein [Geobacteraceae bacterium]
MTPIVTMIRRSITAGTRFASLPPITPPATAASPISINAVLFIRLPYVLPFIISWDMRPNCSVMTALITWWNLLIYRM